MIRKLRRSIPENIPKAERQGKVQGRYGANPGRWLSYLLLLLLLQVGPTAGAQAWGGRTSGGGEVEEEADIDHSSRYAEILGG